MFSNTRPWATQEAVVLTAAVDVLVRQPKLIYTVILWYRFVVPPQRGEPSLCDPPPPPKGGGDRPDKIKGGGAFKGAAFM